MVIGQPLARHQAAARSSLVNRYANDSAQRLTSDGA